MPEPGTNGDLKANELDLLRQIKERGGVTSDELRSGNAVFEGIRLSTHGYLNRIMKSPTQTEYTINERGIAKLEESAQH